MHINAIATPTDILRQLATIFRPEGTGSSTNQYLPTIPSGAETEKTKYQKGSPDESNSIGTNGSTEAKTPNAAPHAIASETK